MTDKPTSVGHFAVGFIKPIEEPPKKGYKRVFTWGVLSENKKALQCWHEDRIMWLPVVALRLYWHERGSPRLYCQWWAIRDYNKRHSRPQTQEVLDG